MRSPHFDKNFIFSIPPILNSGKNLSDLAQPLYFTDEIPMHVICLVLPAGSVRDAGLFVFLFVYYFFQWPNLLRSAHFSQDFCLIYIQDFFLNVSHCPLKH